jgi:sterol-4alpha-carboxylate 3-dehydrogenase (decarboxylating)
MVQELVRRYPTAAVASLDLAQRHFPEKKSAWSFCSADLTDEAALVQAFQSNAVTTVFHTASPWTGSGAEICEKVNVTGTRTVIDAALKAGVKKLVYTSSASVCFNGGDLKNVDERMPYLDGVAFDPYNLTKVRCDPVRHRELYSDRFIIILQGVAERMILEANGNQGLLTCAIRPAGIFGYGLLASHHRVLLL